jgi:glycosyltransferase involved in cell wall biosynthesis
LTGSSSPRPRALVHGTFDASHTRNRMMVALLAAAGWEPTVLRREVWGADRFAAVHTNRARLALRAARSYGRLALQAAVVRRPDAVVILYPGHVDMLVLAPIWKLRRVPVVFDPLVSLHDTVVSDRALVRAGTWRARIVAGVDRLLFALADVVVVDTPEVGAFYAEHFGLDVDRTVVISPGADTDALGPPAADSGGPKRVVFHGTYIPLHGIDTIVRAAALLADTGVEVRIIGSGQERPAVEALLRELGGVPQVTLLDRMPPARIGDEIRAASVCLGIFGTRAKTARVVPFKVFEYMALARPVVTADTPAARAALGDDVVFVPPGDAPALAAAIRALLGDDDRRRRLGRAAEARFAARFSIAAQAPTMRASLERLTDRARVAA